MANNILIPTHENWHESTKMVLLPTGIRMAYMECGNLQGEPLVMIHGFSDSSRIWRSVMQEMGNDYHFYAVDLRGFGLSDKPEQMVYTITEHASDIAAWMEQMGLGPVLLMGHSMGSIVAQTVAAFCPERIRCLVLLSTFSHMHETPEQVREVRELYDSLDIQHASDDELQKIFVPDPGKLADVSFLPGYLSTLRGIRGRGLTAAWFGMSLADNRNFLQFIKAPVLICWGSKDDIFTKEYQDEMLCYLPEAEFETFEGVSHDIPTEAPRRTADAVHTFFSNCP
ncbi:alpha/beta hydrolase [Ruminococcus sp. OA3]|uniref:alpha/beta fold hydrolase n=1 Tax=Ruminococcus sp. OA3 TaxID=2914164 RepID=UPI001F06934B|nr:alpha/beta hydrolase [Ruminococcus sp. OA3]MCH1981913.1 alpha/beta hydrolase [Ruminococcus sp. OA3]